MYSAHYKKINRHYKLDSRHNKKTNGHNKIVNGEDKNISGQVEIIYRQGEMVNGKNKRDLKEKKHAKTNMLPFNKTIYTASNCHN